MKIGICINSTQEVEKIIQQEEFIKDFSYFCNWIGTNLFQNMEEKKKRYTYLVLENVGFFQIGYKNRIVVLTL